MPTAASLPVQLPDPSRDRAGWLILLPVAVLILTQILVVTVTGRFDPTGLGDPDAYMRLTRVQALEDGAGWFDPREPRIGPATGGHVQHWTRPLDLLLWLGARLLAPAIGFEPALLLAGQLFSPAMLGLALLALNWASAPLLDRQERFLACLLLLLQPAVLSYGGLGRADHHSLLLLLFLLFLGLGVRALDPASGAPLRSTRLAGGVAGLALWISSEALLFVGAGMIALGLPWLWGRPGQRALNQSLVLWTTGTLGLALLIERGGHDPLAAEADRISLVHVGLFALITLFWWAAGRLPDDGRPDRWPVRLLAGAAGALLVAILMVVLFPDLRHGVLGRVDPVYQELRLGRIVEIQPPVRPEWVFDGRAWLFLNRLLFWTGLAILAVPLLVSRLARGDTGERCRWLPIALAASLLLPLTFYQVRWAIYGQSLLVVPYAAAVGGLLRGLAHRLPAPWLVLVRPPAIVLSLLWSLGAAALLPGPAPVERADEACRIGDLSPILNRLSEAPLTILAMADVGSEILYRTHHRVLSIPNHRPQPGFVATAEALSGADPSRVWDLLARHGVDWILLCRSAAEASFVEAARRGRGGAEASTLYDRLLAGDLPAWLRPVPMPGFGASGARMFERIEREADGSASSR